MPTILKAKFDYAGSNYVEVISSTAGKKINIVGLSIFNNESTTGNYQLPTFEFIIGFDVVFLFSDDDTSGLFLREGQSYHLHMTRDSINFPYFVSGTAAKLWMVNSFARRVSGIIYYYLSD